MSRFEKQPVFTTLPGVLLKDKPFALTQPLVYQTDVLPDRPRIVMPAGFRSDLATIPRVARRLFSVADWWRDAAWPHDFCCDPVDENLNTIPHFCSSDEAADIWHEALMDTITSMTLTVKQYARRKRTAAILTWFVRHCGPKFKAGE